MKDIEIRIRIILEMYSKYKKGGFLASYPQSEFQEKFNVSKTDADRNFDYLDKKEYIEVDTFGPTYVITEFGVKEAENYIRLIKLFALKYKDLRKKYEKEIPEKEAQINEKYSVQGALFSSANLEAIFKLYSETYKQLLEKHVEYSKQFVEDEESLTILRNHLLKRIQVIVNIIKRKMEEICLRRRTGDNVSCQYEKRVNELKGEWLGGFNRNLDIYELEGFKRISLLEQAFVLMPMKEPFDSYYKKTIKPAIEKTGIESKRADEIYKPGDVPEQILDNLKRSKIIVADITEENLNVIYEVGVAHNSGRDVIFLTQKKPEDAPFDFRHHRIIQYNPEEDGWEIKLEEKLIKNIETLLI